MSGLRDRQEAATKQLAEFPERDPHPIIEASGAGEITYMNAAARDRFSDAQAAGRSHFLLADWPALVETLRREPARPATRVARSAGRTFELRAHIIPDRDRVRLHVADITDRANAEEVARRFELIADSARDFMTLINAQYVYEAANESYCHAHKMRREALLGKSVSQVWGEQVFRTIIKGHLEKCFAGQETKYQLWIEFPGLGRRYLTVTYYPHRDASGAVTHAAVVSRDITEEIETEEKLRKAAKQDVLRRMASGVLHEIEEPVRAIQAELKMLDARLAKARQAEDARVGGSRPEGAHAPELHLTVTGVDAAADRMRAVIEGLRSFCSEPDVPRETVQVNSVIEKVLARCGADIRHSARVVTDFGSLPTVRARMEELERVFEPILVNAARSFEKKGLESNKISVESWQEGSWIKVAVSDNGREIPPHERELMFDPFFTATRHGKESGLGLSVCHNIVTSLGGVLEVLSEEGRGTQFVVSLPVAAGAAPQGAAVRRADGAAPAKSRAYIIAVDDDPEVGSTIRNLLGSENEVITFTGAREALKLLRRRPAVDIIFCDLMMPEMSGMDLYAALEAEAPDLAARMVFLSGGLTSPHAEKFLKSVSNRRCGKPIGAAALRALVKEIMER